MQEPMMGSWMMWMLRALWLVVAHNLLEYRYGWRSGKFVLFNLYCSTWRAVLKMFGGEIISNLASESLEKKFSCSYLQRRKLGKSRQKEFSTTWECLNCKKSSQQLPSCVIAARGSLFCKMFSHIILLWARKDFQRLFEEIKCIQLG